MQGSIVDLFLSCGLAVAPQPRAARATTAPAGPAVSAMINFTSRQGPEEPPCPGRVALTIPEELFALMKLESTRQPKQFDWVRELTNQLAARLKHRLLPFDVDMQPALPNLVSRSALDEQQARERFPNARTYVARTLRSEIIVTLQCGIDESRLNYAGAVDVANAGDVIVF